MADLLLAAGGAVLLVAVFADALATTLAVSEGAGPGTRQLTGGLWRLLLRVHRPDTGSPILTTAGAALLIGTVLLWVLGLWGGWTLVLLAGDPAVVHSTTGAAGDVADVVYYAGFTVFTLGMGDFVAADGTFRILTSVASFTGLFLVTLAITYLISVVSAVVDRRALAVRIGSLGSTPAQIAACGWDGRGFSSAYVQHLVSLTGQVTTSAEQQLAYPALGYFRSRSRRLSAPVAIAQLDDALLLLEAAVEPGARPHPATVAPARRAVARYLETVAATSATPAAPAPPAPDLSPLVAAGVPLVAADDFARHVESEADRRTRLGQLVAGDGWSW